tara:strand:+ start:635 stop:1867 length:1233 start_codon:yes stop_codon:yes gene_type:complete
MSLVDSLDAKLFARKDKQFEQNMQMENLKLKSVIAANDAKFKEGQLANQQSQIVGNQQYRNALVDIQNANLALNQRKQAFAEDENLAFRDSRLANLQARTDLTQAQTGGQMAITDRTRLDNRFAQESFDQRLDNLSLTGELTKSQIKAQDLANALGDATFDNRVAMSGLGVEGAKLSNESARLGNVGAGITNQMNQNILNYQPKMLQQGYEAGQVGIDANKQRIEASKAQIQNDQARLNIENEKLGLAKNEHTFQKQQYEDMMKKLPNEARFMGNYTNNMNPVTNALLANVNTKGNNVKSYAKTFLGYAFASPSLVQSGKADREIINSIKKTKYNDISTMLGNLNTMLGSGNANIDQINAGNATAQFIINNAKDFGFASKDRKKLMLQAQRISNMINAGKKASVPPMQTK